MNIVSGRISARRNLSNGFFGSLALVSAFTVSATASAQVTETGVNFPEPVVGGTTNLFQIGHIGTGTLTVEGGSQFTAGGLVAGSLTTGNGTITVDGTGTSVTLTPPNGIGGTLSVGQYGTGLMTISGGAAVSENLSTCISACTTFVTQAAGSTGTLNITGAGSTLSVPGLGAPDPSNSNQRTQNQFIVGTDQVREAPDLSGTFGTPGASSSGTVNITAGGVLNTGNAVIGDNGNVNYVPPPGATNNPTGTETATGAVNISGSGSTWNVVSPNNSGLGVGLGTQAPGTLTISNGGTLNLGVSGSGTQVGLGLGGSGNGGPGITGGVEQGTGTVTVDGGTITYLSGTNDFLNVGRALGEGTMTVKNGGSVSGLMQVNVGRDGSTGSLTVDGSGSSISMSGSSPSIGVVLDIGVVDNAATITQIQNAAANLMTSFPTSGTVSVTNGGTILLNTNTNTNGGMNIGLNGGTGTLTITGSGSQVSIVGDDNNSSSGGGAAVGRSGTGTLNILAGGQFTINNTGTAGSSGLSIGGNSNQVANGEQIGTGTVTVSGAGSALNILSAHGTINAGFSGSGTLNVQNGGTVAAERLILGVDTGSTGQGTIDGTGSSITLAGTDSSAGARANVGESGIGTLSLSNHAQLLINPTTANGGVVIGGATGSPSGVGTMTVSGGSEVLVSGQNNLLDVGRNGTGTLTITGGSTVDVAHGVGSTGQTFVGASAPGITAPTAALSGSVTVANSSTLNAGSLLGIGSDGVNNNTGSGSVLLSGNSTVNATNVIVGTNGLLGGNGTVNGSVTNNGGTVSAGASPDPLHITGNYAQTGGTVNFEIDPDGHGGFLESTLVFDKGNTVSIANANIEFNFLNGADPLAFFDTNDFGIDTFFNVSNGDLFSSDFNIADIFQNDTFGIMASGVDVTQFDFSPVQGATALVETAVPEPGSLGMLAAALIGLAGIGYVRRRRSWHVTF